MVDQQLKNRALHRAKIIRGQLEGLMKAIAQEEYCPKLMEQSLSIQKSLKSLDAMLLENHIRTHVKQQLRQRSQDERAVRELVDLYTFNTK